jgi:hypothetical protein
MPDALVRIRVLRRHGYRCLAPLSGGRVCGMPASRVSDEGTEEGSVPLCHAHSRGRA